MQQPLIRTPSNSRTVGYACPERSRRDARGRLAQTLWQTGSFAREDILHDANGNRSIQYDARGNTLGETRSGEEDQANVYNGMDERVLVSSGITGGGMTSRRFVYDPDGRVLGEYGTSALDVIAERIWMTPEVGDGGMFGGDDGTGGYAPIAIVAGNTLSWVHANHMGVPQLHTDASGAIIATPAYTLPRFPGQFRTFADLYYYKYRDYDVSTGRYIQADPIGLAGGQSPYSYAMGNPLRYTDPTGEFVPAVIAFCMTPLGAVACTSVVGAITGVISELAIQAGSNAWNGRDVFDRNCYDWTEVGIAGGLGALGGGAGRILGGGLRYGANSLTRETGLEWSHSIGKQLVDKFTGGKLNQMLNQRGGLNGRWVTDYEHYMHDPDRWLKGGAKVWGDKYAPWRQPFGRTPAWMRGIGTGTGAGVAAGEADGQCSRIA